MNNRMKYVDIAKFIAVLFVLIDHAQYYGINVSNRYMTARVVWIAFFLPVFFIVAGVTTSYKAEPIISVVKKKFKGIVIPYIIWCFMLNYSGMHDLNFFKNICLGTVDSLENSGINSVLWFLPCYFSASCIAYIVLTIARYICDKKGYSCKKVYILCVLILSVIDRVINTYFSSYMIFGLKSAFIGASLIVIGIIIKDTLDRIYLKKRKVQFGLAVCLSIVGVVVAYINMPVLIIDGSVIYEYAIWMAQGYVGRNIILYYVACVSLSVAILLISMCLKKLIFLSYLGEHSMLFMTLHIYTHSLIASHIVPKLNMYTNQTIALVIFVLLSVLFIVALLPIVDKFFSFLYKSNITKTK